MKEFDNHAAVFGGSGSMGELTQRLLKDIGFETTSPDPRNPTSPRPIDAIRGSQVVFFSVLPIEEIPKIIDATQDAFGPDHLVLDNASVKGPLRDAYSVLEARGVSICSTHPLFKPDQPTHGQKALIMPVGTNSKEATELAEKLYGSAGIKLIPYSFGDHDKNMVVVQTIPHVIMRAVGMALADAGVDVTTLDQIATPNSTLFDLSLFRAINQKPEVSAAIVNSGINQEEGRALVKGVIASLGAQMDAATSHDQAKLASMYDDSYIRLNQNGIGATRNEQTTFILEMVANLALNSLTVTIPEDSTGELRKLLEPFEKEGVSLTAIASHEKKPGVKFYIGLDERTTADQQKMKELVASLVEMGCVVDFSKIR